jgi:hypothetical protein
MRAACGFIERQLTDKLIMLGPPPMIVDATSAAMMEAVDD